MPRLSQDDLREAVYCLAMKFLVKSLAEAGTVVYLLRLNMLESLSRRDFRRNPPSHLFVLARRPSFVGKGTDSTGYGWFVWDRAGVVTGDGWLRSL
jgi:hypothetical protein